MWVTAKAHIAGGSIAPPSPQCHISSPVSDNDYHALLPSPEAPWATELPVGPGTPVRGKLGRSCGRIHLRSKTASRVDMWCSFLQHS